MLPMGDSFSDFLFIKKIPNLYKIKKTDIIFYSVYSKKLFVKQTCILNKSLYNNDL